MINNNSLKLSIFLLLFATTYANCVPVMQKEIMVTNQREIMICDHQPLNAKSLTIYQNNISNSTNQTCQDCQLLVHIIQHQMNVANQTIGDIITLVKDICIQLHSPSGKECLIIIEDIKQIMQWIIAGSSFEKICQKLGFCSF